MEKPSIPWQFCDCLWLFGMTSLVKGSSAVVNISKSAEVVVVVVVVVDFNLLEEVNMPALVKSASSDQWVMANGASNAEKPLPASSRTVVA